MRNSVGLLAALAVFCVGVGLLAQAPPPPTLYALTVEVVGQGEVDVDPKGTVVGNTHWYTSPNGSPIVVDLTAIADPGWRFDHWSGDVSGTDPTTSLTLEPDPAHKDESGVYQYTVTAHFTQVCTVTVSAEPPEGGTVSGGGTYDCGSTVTVTANPNPCYEFVNWTEDGNVVSTDPSYTFTLTGDRNLVAHFQKIVYTLTVELDPSEAGTVVVTPEDLDPYTPGYQHECGTQVTLNAIANRCWGFAGWSGDASGESATVTLVMDSDKAVTAHFVHVFYAINIEIKGKGTVELYPYKSMYCEGDVVELTAVPAPGWQFKEWQGDIWGVVKTKTLVMDRDKHVTAVFTPTEIWVDDDWKGTPLYTEVEPCKIFGVNAFATIQEGVEAAPKCGTVHVRPGTYAEDVKIAYKCVHLLGPNAENSCPDKGARGPEAVVVGSIRIMGGIFIHGTSIKGFTILAPEDATGGANVVISSLDRSIIKHVVVQNNIIDTRPARKRIGLIAQKVEDLLIKGNCFLSGRDHGAVELMFADGVVLTENDFAGEDADYAVNIGRDVLSLTIRLNGFHGYTGDGAVVVKRGANAGQVVVRNNNFEGNDPAVNNMSINVLDAKFNWWGSPAGPSYDGAVNGDPVVGKVIFQPWLEHKAF